MSPAPVKGAQGNAQPRIPREKSESADVPTLEQRKKLPYYQEAAIVLGADGSPAGFVDGLPGPAQPPPAPAPEPPPAQPTTGQVDIPDARTAVEDLPPSKPTTPDRDLVVILEDGEVRMPPVKDATTPHQRPPHILSPQTLQPVASDVQPRREGMSWDVSKDHAVITRRRAITGPAYASVASTIAFMLTELYKDLGRLERGHTYDFKIEVWRAPEEKPNLGDKK